MGQRQGRIGEVFHGTKLLLSRLYIAGSVKQEELAAGIVVKEPDRLDEPGGAPHFKKTINKLFGNAQGHQPAAFRLSLKSMYPRHLHRLITTGRPSANFVIRTGQCHPVQLEVPAVRLIEMQTHIQTAFGGCQPFQNGLQFNGINLIMMEDAVENIRRITRWGLLTGKGQSLAKRTHCRNKK